MATIDKSKGERPYQSVADARPNFDGPHSTLRKDRKKPQPTNSNVEEPAYVVAVTKKEEAEGENVAPRAVHKYNPDEARAKARALLASGKLSGKEKSVLKEILGPDKDE